MTFLLISLYTVSISTCTSICRHLHTKFGNIYFSNLLTWHLKNNNCYPLLKYLLHNLILICSVGTLTKNKNPLLVFESVCCCSQTDDKYLHQYMQYRSKHWIGLNQSFAQRRYGVYRSNKTGLEYDRKLGI